MSDKNFYPPPGQQEPTSEDTTVTYEQSPRPTTPQQQNVPPGQRNNMPVNNQKMPPQYVQNNQKPMPQMQYGQQQYNQQQYYQQPIPQQQYQQPMPQQYAQQAPQQYAQPIPQQYAQPAPQQYAQQMPQQYAQPMPQQYVQVTPQHFQPMPSPMIRPSPVPIMSTPIQPWTTGLFDCAEDADNCLITFFCPCITLGQVAEITDRGMTTCSTAAIMYLLLLYCTGFHWVYSWMYRSRLRALYSLAEDPFHDCLVHFFCDVCALCQEYRELQNRGFNMQLGWIGNMQLQAQREAAAANAPPPVQGMTR